MYDLKGTGSFKVRAREIDNFYQDVVPILGTIPQMNDASLQFLRNVHKIVAEAIGNYGGKLSDL
ncbi:MULTISPECIES: hypothetical protein [unclassified Paenibacillus]|uniref:hypothetical protein n=1 Tax=unclassified Paenibacillus TaxID=185978 RepID=UPI00277FBC9E|nr:MULTISPECIES: hypothetical protein [unclassified Paenibacillus]MDQ0902204.1 hypothetical protein [Paenibacillus sp. V4I7]MDQ0919299.1 hypothetical protein [Paenibacillus sp. V4I5]